MFQKVAWIWSHHLRHLQWKFKLWVGKFAWGVKAKHGWALSTNFENERLLTSSSNVLPYYLKQTFPPIIWIFTQGEGDEIESRLSSDIFSTLMNLSYFYLKCLDMTREDLFPKIGVYILPKITKILSKEYSSLLKNSLDGRPDGAISNQVEDKPIGLA